MTTSVIGSVDAHSLAVSRGLTRVFGMMFLGLLVSAAASMLTLRSERMLELVFLDPMFRHVFRFAPLAFVFALGFVWKMSPMVALSLFLGYATVTGISLTSIFLAFDHDTIALAFFSAAGMFGVMAIFGKVTKKDLSRLGPLLFMALIGLIVATVINIFMRSSFLDAILAYATVVIFLGFTAHDVQKIKKQVEAVMDSNGNVPMAVSISGALHLYLDFINLFMAMLRILARRRGR